MKKKLISFMAVLLLVCSIVFVAVGCDREKTISGKYKYEVSGFTNYMYFYDDGTGYMVFFEEGELDDEGAKIEYRFLDDNYLAIVFLSEEYETLICEYEFKDGKNILILNADGEQFTLIKQ